MTRVPSARQNSIFDQPRAVWAVAFAAVIAFMGIGLIGPILPTVTVQLGATPTQTSLLFTSYLAITGLGMFFTSWVSSRIGFRTTLMLGLAVIVVAAALAGFATSIEALIAFRALWGLGNALFISTALASIISAANGSAGSAIIIYEAALGLGIAMGPLAGGLLGMIGWQAPFFGTSVLMLIALSSILFFLPRSSSRPERASIGAPFHALAVPSILTLAVAAFLYNIGFFVLMSYTPYPLGFTSLGIGMVFTGWGLGVALTSVFGAPLLTRRVSPRRVLWAMLLLFAAALAVTGLEVRNTPLLVAMVVVGGLIIGVINTVLTECVMEASDLPRAVASSSYSGVRFLGGAIAPPVAAALAAAWTPTVPFLFGAAAAVLAALLVLTAGRTLDRTEEPVQASPAQEAEAITLGE
ncbi:MFS transporter [Zhihengliuella alba]|uniref:MFS transporter n=1 Tax=Zhihengliuella alba TaxID=547018 RepID=A0ABP7E5U0_9MICC